MKQVIFKILFPKKYERILDLEENQRDLVSECWRRSEDVKNLEEKLNTGPSLADLMRDSLGLPMIDFVNVDESGLPKHPFKNLSDVERRSYVFSLDQIYTNRNYHEIMDYCINLLGNKAVLAQSEEARHTAGLGIVSLKMFRKMIEDAHDMAEEFRKNKDGLSEDEALEIISD